VGPGDGRDGSASRVPARRQPWHTIADYTADASALGLDPIVERATRFNPDERPEMRAVAAELREWLEHAMTTPEPPDIEDLAARYKRAAAPELAKRKSAGLTSFTAPLVWAILGVGK